MHRNAGDVVEHIRDACETLILNALLFWAGTGLVAGVVVEDFWSAFWGALVYSILTWIVSLALSPRGTDTIVIKIHRRD